jgi:hypothetical protein
MSIVNISPLVLKDFVLTIGADQFEKNVSSVIFTPSSSVVTWQGGTPEASFTDTGRATWTAAINYAQDWDTANSLSQYLYANEGATVPASFRPRNGVGPSFSASLVVTPGAIGGAVNAVSEASVTLGVQGKPVLVPGAATIPTVTATSPVTGPIAGGTLVKVSGSKFTGTTAVKFGTVNATSFAVDSDGTLYAVAPAQAAGSKVITVTNATGVSTTTGAYTYA